LLRNAAVEAAKKAVFERGVRSQKLEPISGRSSYIFIRDEVPDATNKGVGVRLVYGSASPQQEGLEQSPNTKSSSGGVLNGKAKTMPKPQFPTAARLVRASGAVAVQILIQEDGTVFSAEAKSGHPLLRRASEIAACGASFSQTFLEGSPVKVAGVITYNFVP
jgi:outer membrane biosynthesis protein TonB